jgi:hypothetical protein
MRVAVVCGERVAVLRLQRRELARVFAEQGFGGGKARSAGFGEGCEGGADAREGQAVRECVEIGYCVGNELWGVVLVALCRGETPCHWEDVRMRDLRRAAFLDGCCVNRGREGLEKILELGFVFVFGFFEVVSSTSKWAKLISIVDFMVGQATKALTSPGATVWKLAQPRS